MSDSCENCESTPDQNCKVCNLRGMINRHDFNIKCHKDMTVLDVFSENL